MINYSSKVQTMLRIDERGREIYIAQNKSPDRFFCRGYFYCLFRRNQKYVKMNMATFTFGACGDGCLAFQGRGRLKKDSG